MKKVISLLVVAIMANVIGFTECFAESDLHDKLQNAVGGHKILEFIQDDYDMDGREEAFAFVQEDEGIASLWYVCINNIGCIEPEFYYMDEWREGLFAEIVDFGSEKKLKITDYGGSGSSSWMWRVNNDVPEFDDGVGDIGRMTIENLTQGDGDLLYGFPSEYDHMGDGTGHTNKRYYFYAEGTEIREFGAIEISTEAFSRYDGGTSILQRIKDSGMTVVNILYRANGIININMIDGYDNENLTLSCDGSSVTLLDRDLNPTHSLEESSYGGIYLEAYLPDIAVYPSEITTPDVSGMILPDSSERVLTEEELRKYTLEELGFIRNEILARHGYIFKKEIYSTYFSAQSWYFPNEDYDPEQLSSLEWQNIETIKRVEAEK